MSTKSTPVSAVAGKKSSPLDIAAVKRSKSPSLGPAVIMKKAIVAYVAAAVTVTKTTIFM